MTARRRKGRYRFKRWVKTSAFTVLFLLLVFSSLRLLVSNADFKSFDKVSLQGLSAADRLKLREIEKGDYPKQLVDFLENHMEALDFVYRYPKDKDKNFTITILEELYADEVPLLIQWDQRWGYKKYGDDLIALEGCGPTALSMAALYLTKNPEYTPLNVSQVSYKEGYYASGIGSKWSLMSEGCAHFGLSSKMVPLDKTSMENALNDKKVIIASMGEGDFTKKGHFIVIKGFCEEGFYVNDPVSYKNSEKIWPYEILKGQIKNMWAMSAA